MAHNEYEAMGAPVLELKVVHCSTLVAEFLMMEGSIYVGDQST